VTAVVGRQVTVPSLRGRHSPTDVCPALVAKG